MSDSPHSPSAEALQRMKAIMDFTPQARALGVEVMRIEEGRVWGRVPYRAELVGDPETGVIAGGVVTTLLDQLCGAAAVLAQQHPTSVATIDLRIDYMRPAEVGADILADAQCYKLTRHVAFVRAIAYERDPDDPIAHATATFMLDSSTGRGAQLYKAKAK
ncbi:MAG: PaaI family thioesterase [Pseudomonadota bacterium]